MEEITVAAGERVRLMLRLAPSNLPEEKLDAADIEGLRGDILFKNSGGEGAFTVVGGPANIVEEGEERVALMLNGTAEGGLGRYTIDRIQLSLPHRAPVQVAKDDPLFDSFCINVIGPEYPQVEEIQPRPDNVAWAERPKEPEA